MLRKAQGYTDLNAFVYKFNTNDVTTTKKEIIDLPQNITLKDVKLIVPLGLGATIKFELVDSSGTSVATVVTGDGAAINTSASDKYEQYSEPLTLVLSANTAPNPDIDCILYMTFFVDDKVEYATK